jgi:hypothetical protein
LSVTAYNDMKYLSTRSGTQAFLLIKHVTNAIVRVSGRLDVVFLALWTGPTSPLDDFNDF